ncbi:hypothetical protein MLD38_025966 [Melastoma candidum]|uniref:Uncharacterized protein n=1 Tax=Melastoma candidum TaxID=119954 RepID=A0ACB9NX33_9MYRT|nr:hypothetical protein MLD38_025966 [Melastoma candidum]
MAVAVHHGLKPSSGGQRCRLQSFTHLDYTLTVLKNNNLAHSSNQASEPLFFQRCFSTPCLSLGAKVEEECDVNPRIEILGGSTASDVRALVVEVAIAIASGVNPIAVSGGLGGVYYMNSRNGRKVAIAKPVDEEPLAFNNPKGFGGLMLGQPGLKRSIRIGETGVRELAAYLLDHGGFSGVPPTALVKICNVPFHVNNTSAVPPSNYKIASLQRFVDHEFDAGEMGPTCFSVASVHKIGILDLRLLNLDRHSGNILAKKPASDAPVAGSVELVPIDHGLCLPEWIDDPFFEWLHWPQAAVPFSESECEYISSLDPFKDAELLRNELPSIKESSIRVLVLCTILLKSTAEAGLCLADIGEMMTRRFSGGEERCSVLEEICLQCKASLPGEMSGTEDKAGETSDETMQFEMETDIYPAGETAGFLGLQETLQGMLNPPKVMRLSSLQSLSGIPDSPLSSICEQDDESGDMGAELDDPKQAIMNRSVSFSVPQHMNEGEGISLGDMSEDEWGLFLESFEKLLPQVIEDTKCKGLKQRLGTSCEF